MDKLGGKIPLLSIILVILVQVGGGIVFLTNLSRDVQNNTDAIVHLVENDYTQYAMHEPILKQIRYWSINYYLMSNI
jgi:hypothetical protein